VIYRAYFENVGEPKKKQDIRLKKNVREKRVRASATRGRTACSPLNGRGRVQEWKTSSPGADGETSRWGGRGVERLSRQKRRGGGKNGGGEKATSQSSPKKKSGIPRAAVGGKDEKKTKLVPKGFGGTRKGGVAGRLGLLGKKRIKRKQD